MAASPKNSKRKPTSGGEAIKGEAVELSAGSIRAIAEAVAEKLLDIGPKLARLGAADTIHSVERPETVFRRAINEGASASELLRSLGEDEGASASELIRSLGEDGAVT